VLTALKSITDGMRGLGIEVRGIQAALPSGVSVMRLTPTKASEKKETLRSLLSGLRLNDTPVPDGEKYDAVGREPEWMAFKFKWRESRVPADLVALERTSYGDVVGFLRGLGLAAVDVSNGDHCPERLLFLKDIYTLRQQDPFKHRGQHVTKIHTVSGCTDIVVLSRDFMGQGHTRIMDWMVTVLIEIKTVPGMKGSASNCRREAVVQLIGMNAANPTHSPPVVLTNLTKQHFVLYLERLPADEYPFEFEIRERPCSSFAAAVHFALAVAAREPITRDFSRSTTPPTSEDRPDDLE
jgi:hypothetical protein